MNDFEEPTSDNQCRRVIANKWTNNKHGTRTVLSNKMSNLRTSTTIGGITVFVNLKLMLSPIAIIHALL